MIYYTHSPTVLLCVHWQYFLSLIFKLTMVENDINKQADTFLSGLRRTTTQDITFLFLIIKWFSWNFLAKHIFLINCFFLLLLLSSLTFVVLVVLASYYCYITYTHFQGIFYYHKLLFYIPPTFFSMNYVKIEFMSL